MDIKRTNCLNGTFTQQLSILDKKINLNNWVKRSAEVENIKFQRIYFNAHFYNNRSN